MPNKNRSYHELDEKPNGEGWLYSEEQQLLTQFRADTRTLHAKWVELRTFTWIATQPSPANHQTNAAPQRS